MLYSILFYSFISFAQVMSTSDSYSNHSTGVWREGSTYNNWTLEYNGYGSVGLQAESTGNRFIFQKPRPSTRIGETHASLALSKREFKYPFVNLKSRVVKQLRTPKPNAWETAWVIWNYKHDHRFYYFALKTNGWELGKVDNAKINPNGPECLWPEYKNCKYNGAQRYLSTGSFPKVKIGKWEDIKVDQENNSFVVYVNNKKVVSFTDNIRPYYSGKIGLYNEDAHVNFDDVKISGM